MADEVNITLRFTASKGGTAVSNSTQTFQLDMGGDQVYHANPSVTTSWATIALGPIDTSKRYFLVFRNTDATNYVELSPNSGSTTGARVGPGGVFYAEIPGGLTFQHRANTAACVCEVIAAESEA